jgi:hypothetical protein
MGCCGILRVGTDDGAWIMTMKMMKSWKEEKNTIIRRSGMGMIYKVGGRDGVQKESLQLFLYCLRKPVVQKATSLSSGFILFSVARV